MNRHNNIEILRIISMILIMMHHYSVHGGFVLDPNVISTNKIIVQFLSAGGKLGVDCFVLITGYFMIKSTFKFEKLLKLLLTIFIYSASIYTISLMTGFIDFNIKQSIKSFFPVIFNQYWFATSYVLLYIFSPYINLLINAIDKHKHFNLIIILVTIWSIIPTIISENLNFSTLGWFATLYIVAAYIRLYPNAWFENYKINIFLSLSSYAFILLSIVLINILGVSIGFFEKKETYFIGMNKLPVFFCAVTLLLWFKNIKVSNSKYIGTLASSMFGVYLIHDNNIVRHLLWIDTLKNSSFFHSKYLIIHSILSIFIVFSCCILIDQAKQYVLQKQSSKAIKIISSKCLKIYNISNNRYIFWLTKRFNWLTEARR